MAKRNGKGKDLVEESGGAPEDVLASLVITKEMQKKIMMLVEYKGGIKRDQEAFKEDVEAVASSMGIKPGDVNEIVSIVIQEQEKGGVLLAKEKKLELTRQVLDGMFDAESGTVKT